jgi:hypothetical protein
VGGGDEESGSEGTSEEGSDESDEQNDDEEDEEDSALKGTPNAICWVRLIVTLFTGVTMGGLIWGLAHWVWGRAATFA